ncbi:hypothetical protein AZE42_14165 [Rhizopogon vesiculosus]|uniref:Uncharacterized protein n=1 Tax=Rhizopogon vesiculosus TaxID=180088 RepID=A0A1J8QU59_9AGAM|nr:hypothetical protein AZE42_14165 [Rhizopogon vesiculosus]
MLEGEPLKYSASVILTSPAE